MTVSRNLFRGTGAEHVEQLFGYVLECESKAAGLLTSAKGCLHSIANDERGAPAHRCRALLRLAEMAESVNQKEEALRLRQRAYHIVLDDHCSPQLERQEALRSLAAIARETSQRDYVLRRLAECADRLDMSDLARTLRREAGEADEAAA